MGSVDSRAFIVIIRQQMESFQNEGDGDLLGGEGGDILDTEQYSRGRE